MPSLDEQILSELSKHTKVIEYSAFREKFTDPNFVDRLEFLITTGEVLIVGYKPKKSKYPKESTEIIKVLQQYTGVRGQITINSRKKFERYIEDLINGREDLDSSIEDLDMKSEPVLFSRENFMKTFMT